MSSSILFLIISHLFELHLFEFKFKKLFKHLYFGFYNLKLATNKPNPQNQPDFNSNKDILLQIKNLSIVRDEKTLIKNLNFELLRGEVLHIKGANASGKTSILKSILGLLPAQGKVVFFNSNNSSNSIKPSDLSFSSNFCASSNNKVNSNAKQNAIFIAHESGLRPEFSVWQSLNFFLDLGRANSSLSLSAQNQTKKTKAEYLNFILDKFNLYQVKNSPVTKLSAGQEKRLSLTRLVIFQKDLWILDEAFSNLDIKGKDLLKNLIDKHLETGGAGILTSHTQLPDFKISRTLDLQLNNLRDL